MTKKIDTKKRNRMAGNHPSYKKKGMTAEQIKKKRAYDTAYHATTERKKYRVSLNAANRKSHKTGATKVGDKKDKSHTKSGRLVNESQKANRARNNKKKGTLK